MSTHINQTLKNCKKCHQARPEEVHAPLRPIQSSRVMQIIEVDFFGPLAADPVTGHR